MAGIQGPAGGQQQQQEAVTSSRQPCSRENSDYDDYWLEIKDIEEDTKETDDNQDEDPSKTPDEGEQEVAWLKDAGYAHLVSKFEEGRVLEEETLSKETASLTRTQAAAVKKRVETLNATLRQKHRPRQKQKVDVRDVFDQTSENNTRDYKGIVRPGRRPSKRSESSFLKRTGGYSMSATVYDETDSKGVETISIQSKGAPESRPANVQSIQSLAPTVESDINLSFSLDTENVAKPANTEVSDGGLPNFVQQKDALGVTRVSDLTKSDLGKVRALTLIEFTALFDTNDITYVRQKHKKRLKDHGIFGVPLSTLLEHDQKRHPFLTVPRIFVELTCFLERTGLQEEGILRVPGSTTRMKALRSELEAKFNSDKFQWDDLMPNDAAGLFKQFIRELPVPLLTFEYLDAFAQVESVQDITQRVQALNLLVLLLPDVHRNTLQMLLRFLKKVVDNEDNKMNLHNVSMIMAPNLFLVASSRRKKAGIKDLEFRMAAGTSNIVRMLIKYQDLLWTIPSFMIAQIRQKYEADHLRKYREKSIMKLLGRREKADTYRKPAIHQETDYQEGVIRVLAPHMNKKYLTPIQLDASTTANDVINKFRRWTVALPTSAEQSNGRLQNPNEEAAENAGSPTDKLFLYEVGGNIGERRLDPNTLMLALLKVNPNAEWIIRVSHETY